MADRNAPAAPGTIPGWGAIGPLWIGLIALASGIAFAFPEVEDEDGFVFLLGLAVIALVLWLGLRRASHLPVSTLWLLVVVVLLAIAAATLSLAVLTAFLGFGVSGSAFVGLALLMAWVAGTIVASLTPGSGRWIRRALLVAAVAAILLTALGWLGLSTEVTECCAEGI